MLGNVTFIERPFHPTTLVSMVGSAVRGRRRQYQTRAILEDLTESEGLLQTALNAGHLGALELHLPELELEASDTCSRFFGRKPRRSVFLRGSAGGDSSRRPRAAQRGAGPDHQDRQATTASNIATIWPDGSVHWVDVRARAVRRPDGSIKSLVGVSSDITARKVAEIERENLLAQLAAERTALAELTATLEQRVEQRTAELMKEVAAREKAQEQLRQAQKMETIGQLTGGVAHDFNNLLMAVMGNLDLLRKRMPDDPRLHRLIDGAMQGAERGASLTQRLLAFARQQDLRAVPVDLRALIQGMIDLLERSLGPRVALRLDMPEGLPPARVDANQLELAILNLAINARDAMPDGGSIEIRVAEYQASERSGAAARPLPETVGDRHRHGHDAGDTEAGGRAVLLVKAARQGHRPRPVDGARPGRAARRRAATLERGRQGHHARRCCCRSRPRRRKPRARVRRRTKVNRSAVILFVDDDPLIAMSTTEMLEDLGHPVIGANSGPQALDILKSEQPLDLMMTDHVMPGMTGIELAAASRECGPRCRSCWRPAMPNCPTARSSVCRGWRSPTIRTSCATGSINCWAEMRRYLAERSRLRPLRPRGPPALTRH